MRCPAFLRKLLWLLNPRDREAQLQQELQFHLDEEAADRRDDGLSDRDARFAARRELGNLTLVQENTRAAWGWTAAEQLRQDLRYGLRALRKSPSFTAVAALTIALGVGANTAVFSLFHAVVLRSLPVSNPEELVFPEVAGSGGTNGAPPYPCLARFRNEVRSFAGLSAFTNVDELRVEFDGRPEQANGVTVSGNYFQVLGVKPTLGRLLEPSDENLDPPVAVISHRYWQRRFAGDPAALGKSFVYGRNKFTIVGIAPPDFRGLEAGRAVDITLPLSDERRLLADAGTWAWLAVARLAPGVSISRAQAETDAIFQSFMSDHAEGYTADLVARSFHHMELPPAGRGLETLRRRFGKPLYALMGIVGLLLLMAAANIANLLLARGVARRREFAIRLAMGGGRARLARQLVTETLLLFVVGAIPGISLARWTVRGIEAMFLQGRRALTLDATLDWQVLAFTLAVTLAAGLASSLFPAWRAFRSDPEQALRDGHARSGESRGSAKLSRALVAFQVAVSLILLVGAVTFARTLWNLRHLDTGLGNDSALTMSIELPQTPAGPDQSAVFWGRLLDNVRGIPGVRSAAMSILTPLSGRDRGMNVRIPGADPATPRDRAAKLNQVSEGYFETLGIPLVRGRLFTAADAPGAPRVVVINETAARRFFAGRDPLGDSIELGGVARRVVGVVRDTKHNSLRIPAQASVFLPMRQPRDPDRRVTLSIVATIPNAETTLLQPIRALVARTDPHMLVSEVITIRGQIDATLLTERLLSELAGLFGILAVLLAAVGLYGVLSHRIGDQRQSIGIRMALGASASSIRSRILGESGLMLAAGLVAGLPVAILAARQADSLLWDVTSGDPLTYAAAIAILSAVTLIGSYLPARRASSIDPADALRHG